MTTIKASHLLYQELQLGCNEVNCFTLLLDHIMEILPSWFSTSSSFKVSFSSFGFVLDSLPFAMSTTYWRGHIDEIFRGEELPQPLEWLPGRLLGLFQCERLKCCWSLSLSRTLELSPSHASVESSHESPLNYVYKGQVKICFLNHSFFSHLLLGLLCLPPVAR